VKISGELVYGGRAADGAGGAAADAQPVPQARRRRVSVLQ